MRRRLQIRLLQERFKKEVFRLDLQRHNEAYGKFVWMYDLDRNKVAFWQQPMNSGKEVEDYGLMEMDSQF